MYTLIPRDQVPLGKCVVLSKFVLQYKLDEHGKVCCCKSHVVTKGFVQRPGIDYNKTYAPVALMGSMRAVLHIGATLDWGVHQMDIKTAFLHGDLAEEVYMAQLMGGKEPGKEDWVGCLNKTLYSLMQAAQGWNQRLHRTMVDNGYARVSVNHCVYTQSSELGTSLVAIHVDNMCATASSPAEMQSLKNDLKSAFDLVDLGEVHFLLGIAILWDRTTQMISLSQKAYVKKITKCLHLEDAHPVTMPLDPNIMLSKSLSPTTDNDKAEMAQIPYLTAVGSIIYAASGTRINVAFAVQHLSQFSSNPGCAHWTATQHMIGYLYTTQDHALVLGGSGDITLHGFMDSDWGVDVDQDSLSPATFSH